MYFIERKIDLSVCYIHQAVKEGYILMPEVTDRYDKYCTFLSSQESERIVNKDVCSNYVTEITSSTCPVDGTFSNLQGWNWYKIEGSNLINVKTKTHCSKNNGVSSWPPDKQISIQCTWLRNRWYNQRQEGHSLRKLPSSTEMTLPCTFQESAFIMHS